MVVKGGAGCGNRVRPFEQIRSFEEFSYGKQSLDGLLFLQEAFLFLGRGGLLFFDGFCLLFTLIFFYLRVPFPELCRMAVSNADNRRDSSVG